MSAAPLVFLSMRKKDITKLKENLNIYIYCSRTENKAHLVTHLCTWLVLYSPNIQMSYTPVITNIICRITFGQNFGHDYFYVVQVNVSRLLELVNLIDKYIAFYYGW